MKKKIGASEIAQSVKTPAIQYDPSLMIQIWSSEPT